MKEINTNKYSPPIILPIIIPETSFSNTTITVFLLFIGYITPSIHQWVLLILCVIIIISTSECGGWSRSRAKIWHRRGRFTFVLPTVASITRIVIPVIFLFCPIRRLSGISTADVFFVLHALVEVVDEEGAHDPVECVCCEEEQIAHSLHGRRIVRCITCEKSNPLCDYIGWDKDCKLKKGKKRK